MCPTCFGRVGGGIFFATALLGIFGVLGPTEASSLFGSVWWTDWRQAILNAIVACLLIGATFISPSKRHPVVLFTCWGLLILSVWAFFFETLYGIHFEAPVEILFYGITALWGLMCGLCEDKDECNTKGHGMAM